MSRFRNFLLVITLLGAVFHHAEMARILAAIPTPSYSHQVFFQGFWRELALRGHEVVVMTTDPTGENMTNLREIDMSSSYQCFRPFFGIIDFNLVSTYDILNKLFFETAQHQLSLPQVRQIIDDPSQHFDLVIVEYLYPSFLALSHRFHAPLIAVTSMDADNILHNLMGNGAHAVLHPDLLVGGPVKTGYKDRLKRFAFNCVLEMRSATVARHMNELNTRFFGDNYPDHFEILNSVDMLFVNNNPLFTAVRPLSPSTISIAGGLHLTQLKPLPKELKAFLDGSSNGVVYFSMGSNVKSISFTNTTLTILAETFRQLPYNVLWKFEDDNLPDKPENVKIMKWLPQQDVLRHKHIKLFVTQGGRQSLEEALYAHVPLIVIPILGDQGGNANVVVNKGVALQLDHRALSVDGFKKAIVQVINNPMYKDNMKRLAMQLHDRPQAAMERAIWWTEYIIRHKSGRHLKGAQIPLYQYFYLDIWTFLIGCVLVAFAIIYFSYLQLCFLYKWIFPKSCLKLKKS